MILCYGDTTSLRGKNWYTVELRNEKTVESTLRRVAAALPTIFGTQPVELFVPVGSRDLGTFELKTGNYIFARSTSWEGLLRLKQVTGVVSLSTKGDSNRPADVLSIPVDFVEQMIAAAEEDFRTRSANVDVNSFVRILDGESRDLCGTVTSIYGDMACVTVQVRTKQLIVETPIRNLGSLDHAPDELRVFYYSPWVAALGNTGEEDLVYPDLVSTIRAEEEQAEDDGLEAKKSQVLGRQQTVTALVKRLVFTGTHKPREIAAAVVKALQEKRIRQPKNLQIVYGIIKHHLVNDHFRRLHPEIRNYRDVISRMGPDFRFTVDDIAAIDPTLGIPYQTGEAAPNGQPRKRKKRTTTGGRRA